ncbi:MAG TPA: mechanosensitive ion channel family protein [Mycobacterium sp.]|uniref:mechanosensitive ion channel domain-containing protein n=1 Tax=Mycolicibacterium sp. TaxID=2320850 RepID=UPI0025F214CC|nr:mechanosensitive ion channel family protein [Mycolicibacterium sp.]HPX36116.1 mechanosensitive ion channel family protein [Mycobacterium sp.]HQC75711.1 mechanosensitive ion channel family protein [Mycobacterium sp.]
MSILTTPWFYWSVVLAIGLPTALVLLTELQHSLERKGNFLARPVNLLRTFIVPLGALLIMLTKTTGLPVQTSGVRILATVFGVFILIMVLSGVSATVFESAPAGSWRRRMPSIFIDVARFAIIAIGVAMIFAYVWGANVGGLFTALGISSIVLGLTLQNSVGQIISGLLLLFEQPFQMGDWVETTSAKGRVTEVNWRATHINTGSGLEIIPNSVLAGQAFANLSRPAGGHTITITAKFSGADAPDAVCGLLTGVAADLPHLHPDSRPIASATSSTDYSITIPVRSPADDLEARSTFQRWLWYASRRAGLRLDGLEDDFSTPARRVDGLRKIAPILRASSSELESLLPSVTVTRFGADEVMQHSGDIPAGMSFVVKGRVRLVVMGKDGSVVPLGTLHEGDFLGQTALTREPVNGSAYAVGEVTVLQIPRDTLEHLVFRKPELLADLSQAIDERRTRARDMAIAADKKIAEADAGESDSEIDAD